MTDRRTGSVGLNVDIVPTVSRWVGSIGLTVDLVPAASVGVSTTQPQAAVLAHASSFTRTLGQAQAVSLELVVEGGGVEPIVATTQAQTVALERLANVNVAATQSTQTSLIQQLVVSLVLTATQAQSVTVALARGYQRVVTATQATAVARQRLIRLTRKLAGQGVRTRVPRSPIIDAVPVVSAIATTQVRLIRQVQIARALEQPQATSTAVVQIDVTQTVATTQAQSLALHQVLTLERSVTQAHAADLPRGLDLIQTLVQPTALVIGRAIELVRELVVGSSVSLESEDVTVRHEVTLSVTQAQAVALATSTTGAPAKHFVIAGRDVDFAIAHRSSRFAAPGRRVRFTVEDR